MSKQVKRPGMCLRQGGQGVIYGKSWETGTGYCKYEIVKPIALTPEWLERCGFERKVNEMQIDGQEFTFNIDDSTYFSSCGGLNGSLYVLCLCRGNYFAKNLQYLHQLQNLYFTLTGEELTINHVNIQTTS